jgi:hypothetical protein
MAYAVFDSPSLALEGENKTLSTTAGYIAVNPGFHEVKLSCPESWRLALSPKLLHCLYYNGTTYTEYTSSVTDRLSTTHLPLDAMANTHYVYLGTTDPILGVYVDVGSNVNAEAATLDVEYCSTAIARGATIAFTDVAGDSDGTDSGGATLAQDGAYTWTLPAVKESVLGTFAAQIFSKCFWMRFKPSAALSATVDVNEIIPIYKNTSYAYMEAGVEYQISLNTAKVGGLVVASAAGTPTLNVSWVKH